MEKDINKIQVDSEAIDYIVILKKWNVIVTVYKNFNKKYVFAVQDKKYLEYIIDFINDVKDFKNGTIKLENFDHYKSKFDCEQDDFVKNEIPSFGRLHHNFKSKLKIMNEVLDEHEISKILEEI